MLWLTNLQNFDIMVLVNQLKEQHENQKPYMPRVVVKMNTGTRVLKSKKDKASTRQALNKKMKDALKGDYE